MQIAIDSNIYEQAQFYANQHGTNIKSVIEKFLVRYIDNSKAQETNSEIPDVVLSLLGAGEPIPDDDLNARKTYYKHLEE
jgi:hypothetical protein